MTNKQQSSLTPAYTSPDSLIPVNDVSRLRALYRYEILDSPPEPFFEKITRLAAKIFNVSSGFVSLVDRDRVWYKANFSSLDVPCVDREDSLCSHTIINEAPVTVFEDTHLIPDLLSSPYVSAEGGIRFYAGAPIITHDGYNLGTVCVISDQPRQTSEDEMKILADLATLVMEHIEMRAMARKAVRRHDALHSGIVVGINSSLKEQVELLKEAANVPGPVNIIKKTEHLATAMLNTTANLLHESAHEQLVVFPQRELVSVAAIAEAVANEYEAVAVGKGQELFYSVASRREMLVDPNLMHEALALLVDHLIKYTPKHSSLAIDVFEADDKFRVEVSNEDTTLKEADLLNMFYRYASLDGKVTGNENSTGLELARAKSIVESHDGAIWAETANHGSATKIVVEFSV
ncbi:GAF domain-containing sensor histidine kinase [Pontibacter akesuensis]|uniref:GAF domain-containing protein n=1 Tax=Pontibacter akesuensis TaxID=388950 RepID=A0A1I7GE27_9BACT|nr:GAF domain-containing protein [Pontibacter akesuensis]GHA57341.1 sensor histidine kinase [Pontibacter akesuensis]SFU46571.1 GAF domain-containing protein [Pontibacter akesuensis]